MDRTILQRWAQRICLGILSSEVDERVWLPYSKMARTLHSALQRQVSDTGIELHRKPKTSTPVNEYPEIPLLRARERVGLLLRWGGRRVKVGSGEKKLMRLRI
jgi:hypothetical protein